MPTKSDVGTTNGCCRCHRGGSSKLCHGGATNLLITTRVSLCKTIVHPIRRGVGSTIMVMNDAASAAAAAAAAAATGGTTMISRDRIVFGSRECRK